MTAPRVTLPKRNRISYGILYTIAGVALFFCVIHAVVGVILDWPPHLFSLHLGTVIILGLLAWREENIQRREDGIVAKKMIDDIEEWLDGDSR